MVKYFALSNTEESMGQKRAWINPMTLRIIKIQVPLYGESSGPGTIASQT